LSKGFCDWLKTREILQRKKAQQASTLVKRQKGRQLHIEMGRAVTFVTSSMNDPKAAFLKVSKAVFKLSVSS
jgi:hypothetical protein